MRSQGFWTCEVLKVQSSFNCESICVRDVASIFKTMSKPSLRTHDSASRNGRWNDMFRPEGIYERSKIHCTVHERFIGLHHLFHICFAWSCSSAILPLMPFPFSEALTGKAMGKLATCGTWPTKHLWRSSSSWLPASTSSFFLIENVISINKLPCITCHYLATFGGASGTTWLFTVTAGCSPEVLMFFSA